MKRLIAACAAVAFATTAPLATYASDHQDSPTTVARPGSDITDVYIFPAADPQKVVLAMNVHPLIPSGQGPSTSFDPGVLYQIKISHGTTPGVEDTVLQFKASGIGAAQTISMYGPVAPAMTGTRSKIVGTAMGSVAYNKPTSLPGGVKFFAGPREDPFYFDLKQFFSIIPDRNFKNHPNVPPPTASCFRKPGHDYFSNFNVLSLIVEMPRTMLDHPSPRVNVWGTTSIAAGNGTWTQIERLGRPAVKEAMVPFESHDAVNRSSPYSDPTMSNAVYTFVHRSAGRSVQTARAIRSVLLPDEIEANLQASGPARYLAVETKGKSGLPTGVVRLVPKGGLKGLKAGLDDPARAFGGRDPSSPVIDLSLGVIYGSLVGKLGLAPEDKKETACLTSDDVRPPKRHTSKTFPYIGSPV
jgi:hypothetical protein